VTTATGIRIPAVQYVSAPDGVDIAYTVSGEGKPFIFLPMFFNHVQDMWGGHYSFSALLGTLAERFRLVNFDSRGLGLSTRCLPEDLTLDDYLSDLDAVLDKLDIERAVLVGSCQSTFLAAHYALRRPERVSALILVNGALSWNAWRLSSVYDTLPQEDWDLFVYNMVPSGRPPEEVQQAVEILKQAQTQRDYLVSAGVWQTAGLERVASSIHVPTLVLHSRNFRLRSVEGPVELARKLPNSRLVLMESHLLFGGPGQAMEVIDSFLADVEAEASRSVSARKLNGAAMVLTPREIEVLGLLAAGRSNQQIGDHLVISRNTVRRHVSNIFDKTAVTNRAQAVGYARDHALV
jgi:pimeloyl-ACP methyl ester carboxylesterase/DNA-binding CsgD family transcriptional regulator